MYTFYGINVKDILLSLIFFFFFEFYYVKLFLFFLNIRQIYLKGYFKTIFF